MSRNMELVDIMDIRASEGDQFVTTYVDYQDGATTKRKHLVVVGATTRAGDPLGGTYENVAHIRIADVTDPRNPKSDYLRIYVRGNRGAGPHNLGHVARPVVYHDVQTPQEESFKGDAFIVAWCGGLYWPNEGGLPIVPDLDPDEENEEPNDNDAKARFIAFNLTRAVQMCENENPNSTRHQIEVMNAGVRNVSYGYNGGTQVSKDDGNIYIGYVPSDYDWHVTTKSAPKDRQIQQNPHGMSLDQNAGFLTFSTHNWHSATQTKGQVAFLDCFDLKQLASIPFVSNTTTTPSIINRLTMKHPDDNQLDVPLMLPTFTEGSDVYTSFAHDVDIDKTGNAAVRLGRQLHV